MKIIFMGTPTFALPSLEKLNARYELLSVFTKIDKVNARGNKIIYSPIKDFALANNLKIYQPENFKDNALIDEIRAMEPDLIVVVAYGKILPKEVLDIPKYGVINLHSSLLPRFRGAAPINAAIIHGDSKSGVSIMYVEEELDAGPVILQKETEISDEDTFLTLHDRLKDMGADLLVEAIELIKDNRRVKYDREKLLRGLTFATVKRNVSREELDKIISDIERGLQNSLVSEISSKELGEKVLEKLRDLDQVAYVRFASVYKEFDDIKSFIEIVEQIKKD